MSEISKTKTEIDRSRELTAETLLRWVDNPALAIPAPMRLMAQFFWIEWRAIAKDELSFSSRIARYHRDKGLTVEDLTEVFTRMNDPSRAERIKFASDFFADLAGLVADTISSRKTRENTKSLREQDNEIHPSASELRAKVRECMTRVGQPDAQR